MKWKEIRKATKVRCIKDVILPIEKLREKFPEREWTPPAVAFRKGEEYFTNLDPCLIETSRFYGAEVLYAEDLLGLTHFIASSNATNDFFHRHFEVVEKCRE